jgi:hypothetical protein
MKLCVKTQDYILKTRHCLWRLTQDYHQNNKALFVEADTRLSSKQQGIVCGGQHKSQSNVEGGLDRVLPLPASSPTSSLTQSESKKNKEKVKTLNPKPILSSQSLLEL